MRDSSIGRTLYCDCKNVGSNPISRQARLAQLVEQCPSKSKVIGSNPVPSNNVWYDKFVKVSIFWEMFLENLSCWLFLVFYNYIFGNS